MENEAKIQIVIPKTFARIWKISRLGVLKLCFHYLKGGKNNQLEHVVVTGTTEALTHMEVGIWIGDLVFSNRKHDRLGEALASFPLSFWNQRTHAECKIGNHEIFRTKQNLKYANSEIPHECLATKISQHIINAKIDMSTTRLIFVKYFKCSLFF